MWLGENSPTETINDIVWCDTFVKSLNPRHSLAAKSKIISPGGSKV